MPKTFWASSPALHYEIEEILLNPAIRKANLILPRGTAKTTLAGEVKPLHHIFVEENGSPKFIVIVSKTQSHSKDRLRKIKDVIEYSPEFRLLFGYWGEQTARVWRDDQIILKNGTVILTRGLGQPIRGLNINGMRPTLIILDDPEDENNTKTPEAMNANLLWLLQGAIPALDEKGRKSKIIVIGTPLNQKCMVETLAEMDDWFTVRRSYLNIDSEGNYYSLWEEKKSVEELLQEKADLEKVGKISVFYKERQCQVMGDEDQLFKEEYMRYYKGTLLNIGDNPVLRIIYTKDNKKNPLDIKERFVPVNIFMGIDPASSTKQTADYSVIFPIAIDPDRNIYTLPYFRKRVTPFTLGAAIMNYYKRFLPKLTRVESTGYQEMLREYLIKASEDAGIVIPGLQIKELPKNSKSARLESLEPLFAEGKVYLLENQIEFHDELTMYPRAKNDDTLDAFFYAQKKIYIPFHSADPVKENDEDDFYWSDTNWKLA